MHGLEQNILSGGGDKRRSAAIPARLLGMAALRHESLEQEAEAYRFH